MPDSPRVYVPRPRAVPAPDARDLTAELNPAQREAAEHGDGPLLVIAGAGTGKTRTLVYRVAHLIERGVRPERILLLTFTRRAARQVVSRTQALLDGTGGRGRARVVGGTFHSIAHRALRRHATSLGLPEGFGVVDSGDAADVIDLVR